MTEKKLESTLINVSETEGAHSKKQKYKQPKKKEEVNAASTSSAKPLQATQQTFETNVAG